MSKVALFIETWPEHNNLHAKVYTQLINELASCQHDILVVTRISGHTPELHGNAQIVEPMKRWKFWEIAKLLPTLISFKPQVIHFVQPELFGTTSATSIVAATFKALFHPVLVLSWLEIPPQTLGEQESPDVYLAI